MIGLSRLFLVLLCCRFVVFGPISFGGVGFFIGWVIGDETPGGGVCSLLFYLQGLQIRV